MECTMECRQATVYQRRSYLSRVLDWLGNLKIEGAEGLSKVK